MKKYNAEEHAQLIYETRLDDFFNYLATQTDLYDALWCMFDDAKEYKHLSQVSVFIKRNQWKPHVFRLLSDSNTHAWLLLCDFAESLRDDSEWDHAASRSDDLR